MKKLLTLALAVCILLTGCSKYNEEEESEVIPKGYTLIARMYSEEQGYSSIYSDGYNVIDTDGKKRSDYHKDAKPALAVSLTAKPAKDFKTFEGTDVINPLTINDTSVKPYIPYNYISDLDASACYLATCKAQGYTMTSLKQDSVSADVEFVKNDTKLRVVIYESMLKIYASGLENEAWR